MKIVADLHCHTSVSDHAVSSFEEMMAGAKRAGHIAIAITNHGPGMNDGVHPWYVRIFQQFPNVLENLRIISGLEANIDINGNIDIDEELIGNSPMEYVIASIHADCFGGKADYNQTTEIYEKVIKNPMVACLGHCGNPMHEFDYERVISQCVENKTIIEINNGSNISRPGSQDNCEKIINLCKKYRVPIALTSDSHISYTVGVVDKSIDLVKKVDFPQELIVNASRENLVKYFKEYRGVDLFEK